MPQIALIIINIVASYLLSRLTAPNGPRIKDRTASGGDYGIPMDRGYGGKVRVTGKFIGQADLDETKHKVGGGVLDVISFGLVGALGGSKYYTYSDTFVHLLLDRTFDSPIEGCLKAIANGKLIFAANQATVVDEEFDLDGNLIWRKYKKNKYFKSLTIYTGHSDQPLDPVLAAAINETGGYPFSALAVFEDLQLADFGNAVPVIEYILQVQTGETLADVAEKICTAARIDTTHDISSTALVDQLVRGFLINEQSSCWDGLKPLMPVFAVDCAEVAGQLRFYKRDQSLRATISPDDMGAYVYGDEPPARYQFKRTPDLALPQETTIDFIDPSRDYQPNTSKPARRSEGSAASNVNSKLPLVMTADEAASAAELMHWDAWLGRSTLNFTVTDAWGSLNAGLAYAVPVAGQYVPYRITSKTRGANGIHEIEAVSDEGVTYTASATGDSGTLPEEPSTELSDTIIVPMDMSILRDGDDDYGYYIAMAGGDPDWTRGIVELSVDAGATYSDLFDSSDATTIGNVTGTLAAGSTDGLDDTLDTTSVLEVVLLHSGMDDPVSATDAELNEGANLAWVGKDGLGEYVQYKTATQTDDLTWELTDLRRGRRGTDFAIGTHASGEKFVLVGPGLFRIVNTNTDGWGDAIKLRATTLYQDESDGTVVDFTNTGEGKRPYSPVNVEGVWDGSNNLTITWDARSRLNGGGLGIDDQDNYEVEILNASPPRTITATGVETADYLSADQAADGITPGTIVIGRVRQLSDVNNGRWRDFLFVGPGGITADTDFFTADTTLITADA